jgi:hypothetical protein
METEVSLRKRLDALPNARRFDLAAPIEMPAAATTRVSLRALYRHESDPPPCSEHTDPDENDAPHLSQYREAEENDPPRFSSYKHLAENHKGFGSSRKLNTGIAVVVTLGLSALAYLFLASPNEKPTTQTAKLAAIPAAATPSAAPAAATPSAAPAAATPAPTPPASRPHSPPLTTSERPSEPVQTSSKVAQSRDVLYLQRPGVNIRSTPSLTGNPVGTAPKGTQFKVTNRQADWIQVESGRLKGWINAGFLAPSEPR